jgi:hypothetical protein
MTATEDKSQERREREEREEREQRERQQAPTGAPPGGSQVGKMIDRGDVPSGAGGRPEEKIETVGGQVYRGGRLIGYTEEGAVSATEGGVVDPTVVPGGHTVTDPNPFEGKEQAPQPKPEKK